MGKPIAKIGSRRNGRIYHWMPIKNEQKVRLFNLNVLFLRYEYKQ